MLAGSKLFTFLIIQFQRELLHYLIDRYFKQ